MKNKTHLHYALLGVLLLVLSACNTVQGMGRDIQSAGTAISSGASSAKSKMSQ